MRKWRSTRYKLAPKHVNKLLDHATICVCIACNLGQSGSIWVILFRLSIDILESVAGSVSGRLSIIIEHRSSCIGSIHSSMHRIINHLRLATPQQNTVSAILQRIMALSFNMVDPHHTELHNNILSS